MFKKSVFLFLFFMSHNNLLNSSEYSLSSYDGDARSVDQDVEQFLPELFDGHTFNKRYADYAGLYPIQVMLEDEFNSSSIVEVAEAGILNLNLPGLEYIVHDVLDKIERNPELSEIGYTWFAVFFCEYLKEAEKGPKRYVYLKKVNCEVGCNEYERVMAGKDETLKRLFEYNGYESLASLNVENLKKHTELEDEKFLAQKSINRIRLSPFLSSEQEED